MPSFLLKLGSIFRSSGRMFYPVYYLILLFTVVFFARRWGAKIGSALLVVILAMQIWDISPALKEKRAYFTSPSPSFENPMKSEFWDAIDEMCIRDSPLCPQASEHRIRGVHLQA